MLQEKQTKQTKTEKKIKINKKQASKQPTNKQTKTTQKFGCPGNFYVWVKS